MTPHGGTVPLEPTTNDVALLFAARDGDAPLVGELLAAGAAVITVNRHGNTSLIMTAQHRNLVTVALLLDQPVMLDAATRGHGDQLRRFAPAEAANSAGPYSERLNELHRFAANEAIDFVSIAVPELPETGPIAWVIACSGAPAGGLA